MSKIPKLSRPSEEKQTLPETDTNEVEEIKSIEDNLMKKTTDLTAIEEENDNDSDNEEDDDDITKESRGSCIIRIKPSIILK